LAKLFIDAGTPHVIAFRSRYQTDQALEFSKVFYQKWAEANLDPTIGVSSAFATAALARPHAEPVLFTQEGIFRAWAKTMQPDSGQLERIEWTDDVSFSRPRFPQRN
jgi:hypothetical protein